MGRVPAARLSWTSRVVIGPLPAEARSAVAAARARRRRAPTSTGTSISGPTTPASAWPEVAPKTPTATAIASSKSFEATVKESAAVCG